MAASRLRVAGGRRATGQELAGRHQPDFCKISGHSLERRVSNVSFGLPVRKLLNEAFLLLLMSQGLDTAIVDPCDSQLMMNIIAAEVLLGKDEHCRSYLRAYREGKLAASEVNPNSSDAHSALADVAGPR